MYIRIFKKQTLPTRQDLQIHCWKCAKHRILMSDSLWILIFVTIRHILHQCSLWPAFSFSDVILIFVLVFSNLISQRQKIIWLKSSTYSLHCCPKWQLKRFFFMFAYLLGNDIWWIKVWLLKINKQSKFLAHQVSTLIFLLHYTPFIQKYSGESYYFHGAIPWRFYPKISWYMLWIMNLPCKNFCNDF